MILQIFGPISAKSRKLANRRAMCDWKAQRMNIGIIRIFLIKII